MLFRTVECRGMENKVNLDQMTRRLEKNKHYQLHMLQKSSELIMSFDEETKRERKNRNHCMTAPQFELDFSR